MPLKEGETFLSERQRRAVTVGFLALAVVIVILHKLIETGFENGINTGDSGIFATIGAGLLHGHLPYSSFWDHKLPGIYFTDALIFWVLPTNPWSLHVGEAVEAILMLAGFYWAVRPLASPLPAAVGTAAFGYVATLPVLNQGGNLTESYWQLPAILALGWFIRYLRGSRPRAALIGAGACMGVATLFAPQSLLGLAVMLATVFYVGWSSGRASDSIAAGRSHGDHRLRGSLRAAGLLTGAWALVVVPIVFWLAGNAGLSAFWEQVVAYNRAYASAVSLKVVGEFWAANQSTWIMALILWAAVAACVSAAARVAARVMLVFLGASAAVAIMGAVSDRHFYPHDILFSVPAIMALLVFTLEHIRGAWRKVHPVFLGASAVLLVATIAVFVPTAAHDTAAAARNLGRVRLVDSSSITPGPPVIAAEHDFPVLSVAGLTLAMTPNPAAGHQLAGEAIDRLTRPTDYVYMYGPEGGMFFVTDRRSASRFLFNSPLINSFGSAYSPDYNANTDRKELLDDLGRHPPALITVRAFSPRPRSIRQFPAFERYLCSRYRVRAYIQGFLFFSPHADTAGERRSCRVRFG